MLLSPPLGIVQRGPAGRLLRNSSQATSASELPTLFFNIHFQPTSKACGNTLSRQLGNYKLVCELYAPQSHSFGGGGAVRPARRGRPGTAVGGLEGWRKDHTAASTFEQGIIPLRFTEPRVVNREAGPVEHKFALTPQIFPRVSAFSASSFLVSFSHFFFVAGLRAPYPRLWQGWYYAGSKFQSGRAVRTGGERWRRFGFGRKISMTREWCEVGWKVWREREGRSCDSDHESWFATV